MIGDSEHGLGMAKHAGMSAIAASVQSLLKHDPLAWIGCLSELTEYVYELRLHKTQARHLPGSEET